MTVQDTNPDGIGWREWSKAAFEEAREKGKLVLLDLTASWCHWCHVMDERTYADPEVARMIVDHFVPVRVDIDRRPDISERYNRGGFPTTAFLSDQGESIWGATYVPPGDMTRIMRSILDAKASGEVDLALERSRMHYLDLSRALERREQVDGQKVSSLFEDVFASYDIEYGGFGLDPKFPYPDAVDLLLERFSETGDESLAAAAEFTLDQMTDGLFDKVEGGVFRYSVTRNWHTPHYEKMLETNLGFLGNLVRAYKTLGKDKFAKTARGVTSYLLEELRDTDSGAFFGSQDADEEYYKLAMPERSERGAPSIDRTVYAGWNSEAVSTLLFAGVVLKDSELARAGESAWTNLLDRLWDPELKLVRHTEVQKVFLFDDQVSFLEALLAVLERSPEKKMFDLAESLLEGTGTAFADPEGGFADVVRDVEAIGGLESPRRPLVGNSRWARALALYGAATHRPELSEEAMRVLLSFPPKDVEAHGIFASSYVTAWRVLERGAASAEVHSGNEVDALSNELWTSAKGVLDPGTIVLNVRDTGAEGERPYAVLCTPKGCSSRMEEPALLAEGIRKRVRRA